MQAPQRRQRRKDFGAAVSFYHHCKHYNFNPRVLPTEISIANKNTNFNNICFRLYHISIMFKMNKNIYCLRRGIISSIIKKN